MMWSQLTVARPSSDPIAKTMPATTARTLRVPIDPAVATMTTIDRVVDAAAGVAARAATETMTIIAAPTKTAIASSPMMMTMPTTIDRADDADEVAGADAIAKKMYVLIMPRVMTRTIASRSALSTTTIATKPSRDRDRTAMTTTMKTDRDGGDRVDEAAVRANGHVIVMMARATWRGKTTTIR